MRNCIDAVDVNATEDYNFVDDHSADEEEGPEIVFDEDDFQEISTGRKTIGSVMNSSTSITNADLMVIL